MATGESTWVYETPANQTSSGQEVLGATAQSGSRSREAMLSKLRPRASRSVAVSAQRRVAPEIPTECDQ